MVQSQDGHAPVGTLPKLLLVDDEQEFVDTLAKRLQARDYEVCVAYDGPQALEQAAAGVGEVMVLDLKMPGMDGIEVLQHVKRDHPSLEVIILTGHGAEKEREAANELGAFAYLHKPLELRTLLDTITAAHRKRLSRLTPSSRGDKHGGTA